MRERGASLIITMVVLAVLAVLAVGAIAFTGAERSAAANSTRQAEVGSCAETARSYLLARLRIAGTAPTELRFADPLLDDAVAARQSLAATGHYDQDGTVATGATLVSTGVGGTAQRARDITNVLSGSATLGGRYYRVVVHCQSRTRQSEIEFLIRFGI